VDRQEGLRLGYQLTVTVTVTWYLKQIEDELVDGEVYLQKQKVVDLVIRRMIKHENRIIEIDVDTAQGGGEVPKEEKRLKIHPSADV